MNDLLCANDLYMERRGVRHIYSRKHVPADLVVDVLDRPGEVLKKSRKTIVRKVGEWVVKESRTGLGAGLVKHTLDRHRYRRGWVAAQHLLKHGVNVPEPIAYVEKRLLGLISSNSLVLEYLEGQRNVEHFLVALIQRGADREVVEAFLGQLATAVNALCASGAYHTDLSGKNIFTRDGGEFYFIDLDSVVLGDYTEAMRLRNHVQLYDSFCDLLNDTILVPFIEQMLLPAHDPRIWMPRVRKGQQDRRFQLDKRRDKSQKKQRQEA